MQRDKIMNSLFKTLSRDIFIYPDSLRFNGYLTCFILKDPHEKYLGIMGPEKLVRKSDFKDQMSSSISSEDISGYIIGFFRRNDDNLKKLLNIFPMKFKNFI